jgi:hypothetical protein
MVNQRQLSLSGKVTLLKGRIMKAEKHKILLWTMFVAGGLAFAFLLAVVANDVVYLGPKGAAARKAITTDPSDPLLEKGTAVYMEKAAYETYGLLRKTGMTMGGASMLIAILIAIVRRSTLHAR